MTDWMRNVWSMPDCEPQEAEAPATSPTPEPPRFAELKIVIPNLDKTEREVLRLLGDAWDEYLKLPVDHPSHQADFVAAIHSAQRLIAIRVARRVDPDAWHKEPATVVDGSGY